MIVRNRRYTNERKTNSNQASVVTYWRYLVCFGVTPVAVELPQLVLASAKRAAANGVLRLILGCQRHLIFFKKGKVGR
jgi:hypothetical protein